MRVMVVVDVVGVGLAVEGVEEDVVGRLENGRLLVKKVYSFNLETRYYCYCFSFNRLIYFEK